MTQPVIFQFGDAELCHQPIIVIAVRAWFGRMFIVGQHIEIIIDYLFNGLIMASNSLFMGISRQEFLVLGVLMTTSVCFLPPSMI